MSLRIADGHKLQGRWILAPLADITEPKPGRNCFGQSWWAVTEHDEVLFFDSYGSPQCNVNPEIARRLAHGFNAPATTVRQLGITFLPDWDK